MLKQKKQQQQQLQQYSVELAVTLTHDQYLSDHIFSIVDVIRNVTTTNNRITKATNKK